MPTTEPITIVADSPGEALARIRERLGPHAVVLSVRSLPRPGLAKLWQRPRVEVRARGPASVEPRGTLHRLLDEIRRLNQQLPYAKEAVPEATATLETQRRMPAPGFDELTAFGLLSTHARALLQSGNDPWDALVRSWRPLPRTSARLHVFVGAPGAGKTTVLCKWLAQVVLLGGQAAQVWRLDGRSANTAESLSIYSEILSVPLERAWNGAPSGLDIGFVDLPGVDWRDARAVSELGQLMAGLGDAEVHLVVNAAYESSLLLQQCEACGVLPVTDLIVTHLDEEPRWGKLWNLVLGTPHPLRFLSVGQNVPGTFQLAGPRQLL